MTPFTPGTTAAASGRLSLVGIGPGGSLDCTPRARQAMDNAEVIVAYHDYLRMAGPFRSDQELRGWNLGQEMDRIRDAVQQAQSGRKAALISSGDVGVYGMAGPCFEWLASQGWRPGRAPDVEVIPGVSACHAAAAALGAPLMQDFACISLSDLLVPWERIEKRVRAVASADLVICIYNPRSRARDWQLGRVREILLEFRSPSTPVGMVRDAARPDQVAHVTDLAAMDVGNVDMRTLVVVGNESTFRLDHLLVTPRGYRMEREQ